MIKFTFILLVLSSFLNENIKKMYTFSTQTDINEWNIVNDGVMGGISKSTIKLTDSGQGKFAGNVSLANNGGFASVQLNKTINLTKENKVIVLRVKGDGKRYEFRLKGKLSQYESYVHPFTTSGEWETIKLDISKFYPQFRGRKLDIPNFNFENIEQLSFLIANKKEEDFALLIDYIGLEF
jgi:NADH dehydrogenase [ubiquinone] 1 alpha subcomplex assembly factor 1